MGSLLFNPCSLEVSMEKGKSKAWLNFLFQRLKKPVKKVKSGAIRQKINYSKHGKMKLVKSETFWRVIPNICSLILHFTFCSSLSHIYSFCGFAAADWQLMVKSFWQRGFPTTVASEVRRSSFITVLEIDNKIVTHTTMTIGKISAKLILKNWIIRDLFHPLNSTCLVELFMR